MAFQIPGLARRLNKSPVLEATFLDLVSKDPELKSDQRSLARRVATRWNSDRKCIDSHVYFRQPIQWLTSNAKLKLKKYALDDIQWDLARELSDVLQVNILTLAWCVNNY